MRVLASIELVVHRKRQHLIALIDGLAPHRSNRGGHAGEADVRRTEIDIFVFTDDRPFAGQGMLDPAADRPTPAVGLRGGDLSGRRATGIKIEGRVAERRPGLRIVERAVERIADAGGQERECADPRATVLPGDGLVGFPAKHVAVPVNGAQDNAASIP